MILLAIIKKTFLQSRKRTEDELIKSFGNKHDRMLASLILKVLLNEKVIIKSGGGKNFTYTPKSAYRKRMMAILKDLNNCKDKIWLQVATVA